MTLGPDGSGTGGVDRLLLVSSREWLSRLGAALDADGIDVTIVDPDEPPIRALEGDDGPASRADCVLADDPGVVDGVDGRAPVVLCIDEPTEAALERVEAADPADVLTRSTAESPALCRYRLERTVERGREEDALGAAVDAADHLTTLDAADAIAEYVVDAAAGALDLGAAVWYRFDEETNRLVPAARSGDVPTRDDAPPAIDPREGVAWSAFLEGTVRSEGDLGASDSGFAATDARSGLYVPLGDHGVLVLLSRRAGRYGPADRRAVDLATLLGATAESGLDRAIQLDRLRDRERELGRLQTRLDRLTRADRVRTDLETALLEAESREEIETGICDRLADLEDCLFAWIGEPDPGGNQVLPRVRSGRTAGYLEAVEVTTVDDPASEPAGRCARTRKPVAVDNVASAVRNGAWRSEALSRNVQSVLSIPLVYDDFLYGVLSVYAPRQRGFDGPIRAVLENLGEPIAHAIDAAGRKYAAADDEVTEIDLEIRTETHLSAVATRLEAAVRLEGAIPRTDESTVAFLTVDARARPADLDGIDGVEEATVLRETDGRTHLQVRCSGPFVASVLEDHGGSVQALSADGSGTRATVHVPRSADARELLAGTARSGFDVSFLAKRERPRERSTAPGGIHARETLLETLTDRQREVVQTAYHGGFFEWPRTATGEEVADSLGISPPAFHNHVRAVQRKLFASLFDAEGLTD